MNLYLLKRRDAGDYDEAFGFVVRASSELAARGVINTEAWYGAGCEGEKTWLDETATSCEEIACDVEGNTAILLRDFRAG